MYKPHILAAASAIIGATGVLSTVPIYGQCGGIGYTGDTTCVSGTVCTYLNDWFYQCLAGSATVSSTSTSKASTSTTTTKVTTTTTSTKTTTTTSSGGTSTVTGFVKTSGTSFTLNGSKYHAVGTNGYWIAQWTNDITQAFSDIAAAGYTTVRTLGFNDVTSANEVGTYYQVWANGVGTLNTGSNGLQVFDTVIATAKSFGIRLIVTLTNNWSDYGGMDVYVSQIVGSGQYHDVFYTNTAVQAAYKKYAAGFVGRYVNEPGIMAWELANEPRCAGSSTSASPTCNSTTIYTWAATMSAYIKSIDSNHLVAIGDEGFINNSSSPIYVYNGDGIGIDFVRNLGISTLDFGTFHMYPQSWGESADPGGFGNQWITDHATAMKNANKPVIVEEFGVTSNQSAIYASWCATMVTTGLTGELFWQAGSHFPDGDSWDDGYAVYPDSSDYSTLVACAKNLIARG
ncbi:mannanase [Clavulina sp. PMI_390]|nr:mannanase [Clavulina sp. PMI_390]